MRIEKKTDAALFFEYENSREFRKSSMAHKRELFERHFNNLSKPISVLASTYCIDNQIETNNADEQQALFYKFLFRAQSMLYERFQVEFIHESFSSVAVSNVKKLLSCIDGETYYSAFGSCSGHIVFGEYYISYANQQDGLVVYTHDRTNPYIAYATTRYGKIDASVDFDWDGISYYESGFNALMAILLLKKYGEIETVLVAGNTRRKLPNSDESFLNMAPFPITQIDSSWLRTIVRTDGFVVRGHFRLQACGEKHRDRKLIYIKPFQKYGYVRRAKKLVVAERVSSAA